MAWVISRVSPAGGAGDRVALTACGEADTEGDGRGKSGDETTHRGPFEG